MSKDLHLDPDSWSSYRKSICNGSIKMCLCQFPVLYVTCRRWLTLGQNARLTTCSSGCQSHDNHNVTREALEKNNSDSIAYLLIAICLASVVHIVKKLNNWAKTVSTSTWLPRSCSLRQGYMFTRLLFQGSLTEVPLDFTWGRDAREAAVLSSFFLTFDWKQGCFLSCSVLFFFCTNN